MTLFVDSRESDETKALVADDVVVITLSVSDFLDPACGLAIEHKTDRDLISSITDGRLDDQCARLCEADYIPVNMNGAIIKVPVVHRVILVNGTLWPQGKHELTVKAGGRSTKLNYWAVMMKLMSIQASGISILIVPSQHLAECVDHLRSWAGKAHHRIVKAKGSWTKSDDPKLTLMSHLVGGESKAKILLTEYGTPGDALCYMHDWTKLKGIGPVSVTRAKTLLGNTPSMIPF
jgi:ERCC4-type nuclease